MSELEALSDIELHAKCLEYDIPNIPITDSTRKILKRRLKAAMAGKVVTSAKKNHRRKSSKLDISPTTKTTEKNSLGISNMTRAKKSISHRTTAIKDRHVATSTVVSDPTILDIVPNSGVEPNVISADKKIELPSTYSNSPVKESQLKLKRLSRSALVATSFMQEPKSKYYGLVSPEKQHRQNFERPTIAVSPLNMYEYGSSCYNIKHDVEHEGDDIQTPFFSQFEHRSETLTSSHLRHLAGHPKNTRKRAEIQRGANTDPRVSLTYDHRNDAPFCPCMTILGGKYHLCQHLVVIPVFIIAVFICVLFT